MYCLLKWLNQLPGMGGGVGAGQDLKASDSVEREG